MDAVTTKKTFYKKNNCIIISIIINTLNIILYYIQVIDVVTTLFGSSLSVIQNSILFYSILVCSDIICCNYTIWFQPKADRHSKFHYVLFYIIILCYYFNTIK